MASKREVKPFVDARTKSAIEKLSYITGESVNKIGESLCTNATSNMDIIEEISQYFKRDLRIHDKTYVGNKSAKVISHRQPDKERISVLLNQQLHEFVYTLSYAIGCSVGKAAALCVEKSIADTHYLNHFIQNYIEKILNDKDQIKLRLILDFINVDQSEKFSLTTLVSYIADEIKRPTQTTPDAIREFIATY